MRFKFFLIILFVLASILAAAQDRAPFTTSIGDELPEFKVKTIDGEEWSSSDESKATIIIVFDPASTVSREMLQAFESFVWKGLQGEGVRVCAIARGASTEQARAFSEELKLSIPVVADATRELSALFADNGRGVPRIIIAGNDNNVAYQHGGYAIGREAEFQRVAQLVARNKLMGGITTDGGRREALPLGAINIKGKEAPVLYVERWITQEPKEMEGKYVLTEFWATWCGPCVTTMPHLQEMSVKHQDKLVIQSISDEEPEEVTKFVLKTGLTYPIGVDTQGRTSQKLQIMGIPHGYITNPKGIVVWQGHPGELVFEPGLLDRILSGKFDNGTPPD